MLLPSSNLRPQQHYKLELSLWSIVIIILIAFASSFFLGWNVSLLLSDNFQAKLQYPHTQKLPTWKPSQLKGNSQMRAQDPASRNEVQNEMFVHPVLFTHPDPKQVAIVSSNPNALIDQVRMHTSVKAIWLSQDDVATCANENESLCELTSNNHESIIFASAEFKRIHTHAIFEANNSANEIESLCASTSNNHAPLVLDSPEVKWMHTHDMFEPNNSATMLDVVFIDE
jgi:hypothetical protein